MKIHAALMTQNELTDLIPNVEGHLTGGVDSVTIVDGGSVDGTIPYMRNWSQTEPRIRFFICPWKDDFPAQRNNYLARVAQIAEPGDWLLAHDPDEFLDTDAYPRLREIIEYATAQRYDSIGFQCRSVSLRGSERCHERLDRHWKRLLMCWSTDLVYGHHGEGPVHEHLHGVSAALDLAEGGPFDAVCYEHRKQENVIWWRGTRNYFCGGGGPNLGVSNPRWPEMRAIAWGLGLRTWHQMLAYLVAGNVAEGLKAWIVRYRHEDGWDGSSEQREWYKLYFRMLHPEEEPPEMQGEHIK